MTGVVSVWYGYCMDTTTRPAPLPPIQGPEPDADFAVCEECERTVFDEWTSYEEAGITVCWPCEAAERDAMMRSLPASAFRPTDDQIRRDHEEVMAWCGPGSDEALKSLTLVRSL